MYKLFTFVVFVVVLAVVFDRSALGGDVSSVPAPRGTFAQFLGVNAGPSGPPMEPSDKEIWNFISWVRAPINWDDIQPNGPTDWKQAELERYGKGVLNNARRGVRVLPVLLYGNPWAANKEAWSYVAAGKRYDVAAFDSRLDQRRVTITDLSKGKTSTANLKASRMPPKDVADWERFVDRVVGFLSKPPYNIEYFQIWNEANDEPTGFWHGNMDTYMKVIHLPAARIIKKYGAKVVYGGYPCNGLMPHYLHILDQHDAWDTLDVLDIHYFNLGDWQQLYDRVKQFKKPLGIWQTEVGFTENPNWVPNHFSRFFYWALSHDWEPDRYKIFQFASWSPDDPKAFGYNRCLLAGNRYTCHAKALLTLGRLLSGPAVKVYNQWQSTPALQTAIDGPSIEGFRCENRIALAVHLLDRLQNELQLTLRGLDPRKVKKAVRVGVYNSQTPLRIMPGDGGTSDNEIHLRVPIPDPAKDEQEITQPDRLRTFYVTVELSE